MAKGRRYAKRRRRPWWAALAAVAVAAAGLAWQHLGPQLSLPAGGQAAQPDAPPSGTLQVYFLDVGQGDSELLCMPGGEHILIDAGTAATEEELAAELERLGAGTLDLVVGTHPHADHIGGMAQVVSALEVKEILLHQVAEDMTPTTKTYEDLLESIEQKGLSITPAQPGQVVWNKDGAVLEVLAPNSQEYSNLNNYSVVLRLTYGEDSFLFTGDAEQESEEEMLAKGYDLSAGVLKCGHHGSDTSTSPAFLKAVSPSAAVISCGEDNDYGHPNQETLDKLAQAGAEVYRTDTQGTILAQTQGEGVTFTTGLPSVK